MEFKFRAVDDRSAPAAHTSSSSSVGDPSYHALPVGSNTMDQHPDVLQRELLHRLIEKERIREEIIAAEFLQRRVLEAEVRRELMVEREMAMRWGGGGAGLSLEERLLMKQDWRVSLPLMNQFHNVSLQDMLAFPNHGVFNPLSSSQQLPEVSLSMASKVRQPKQDNKEKLIVLVADR